MMYIQSNHNETLNPLTSLLITLMPAFHKMYIYNITVQIKSIEYLHEAKSLRILISSFNWLKCFWTWIKEYIEGDILNHSLDLTSKQRNVNGVWDCSANHSKDFRKEIFKNNLGSH